MEDFVITACGIVAVIIGKIILPTLDFLHNIFTWMLNQSPELMLVTFLLACIVVMFTLRLMKGLPFV